MQILYAIAIAAVIGLIVWAAVPGRASYGAGLAPALAAGVAAVVWAALTWVGWDWSNLALWLASLGTGLVAVLVLALVTPGARRRADDAFFERARRA
ncbi:MAG: hypothetical protein J7480_01885 [Microbacteriaceae bacterium]|nr:hypothetical protein [Microbacteriaceae bacterium]